MLSYVDRLARGGSGFLILGHGYIKRDGRVTYNETCTDRADQVPRLALVAEQARRSGAKIAIQISHGGRQCRPSVVESTPVAPSAVEVHKTGVIPRELSPDEIVSLIADYRASARRVKEAGFDAIQIHAAHGYLISQFLSPATNRRKDAWGGTPDKRRRFFLEVLDAVHDEVGPEFPVLIKLNLDDCIPDGVDLEEALGTAVAAAAGGVAAIEVSGGMVDSERGAARKEIEPGENEAYFRSLARAVGEVVECPVILVGGLKSLPVISDVLSSGDADLVAMGRPLVREPQLPLDWFDGRQRPADCHSCNRCALYKDRELRCESLILELAEAEGGGAAAATGISGGSGGPGGKAAKG
jgi:2,4-dienoyl-CoA reductase-like NADH-dependent reductase (Old Yellow Enzyme family)